MKQLHKQHWLIICMILVMIVSASGMDVTSLPQGHSPEFSANGSLIQTTTVQNSSLELCSPELLGVRLIQPRLSNARPVTLRQDGRQQHDLTLLYTIAVLSICTFFPEEILPPPFTDLLPSGLQPLYGLSTTRMGRKQTFYSNRVPPVSF